jgi:ATP-dependent Clp protease ATP-binding subunit ClpB
MNRIVEIQVERLQSLLRDRKIELVLDEKAKSWLANAGYDPVYGARPLKRVIQRSLQNSLAEQLLAGTIKDGDRVAVSAGDKGLLINGQAGAREAA